VYWCSIRRWVNEGQDGKDMHLKGNNIQTHRWDGFQASAEWPVMSPWSSVRPI
jgi:hypothetical protein